MVASSGNNNPDWLLALAIIIVSCAETGLISFLPLGDIVQGWWHSVEIGVIGILQMKQGINCTYMEGKAQGLSKVTCFPYFSLTIRPVDELTI